MIVTKYRSDILTDEIVERLGEIASDIATDFGVNIQNVIGGSAHVHILFTAEPTTELTKFIDSLKGVSSRKVQDEYPETRQALDNAFWQPGYFPASTGQVSIDLLMDYVNSPRGQASGLPVSTTRFASTPKGVNTGSAVCTGVDSERPAPNCFRPRERMFFAAFKSLSSV